MTTENSLIKEICRNPSRSQGLQTIRRVSARGNHGLSPIVLWSAIVLRRIAFASLLVVLTFLSLGVLERGRRKKSTYHLLGTDARQVAFLGA